MSSRLPDWWKDSPEKRLLGVLGATPDWIWGLGLVTVTQLIAVATGESGSVHCLMTAGFVFITVACVCGHVVDTYREADEQEEALIPWNEHKGVKSPEHNQEIAAARKKDRDERRDRR